MPDTSELRSRASELEIRLRTRLTELAVSDQASLERKLNNLEAELSEMEVLRKESADALPWPPDASARLSVCRLEVKRLLEGKTRRRDAVGKIRLLIPRFTPDRTKRD